MLVAKNPSCRSTVWEDYSEWSDRYNASTLKFLTAQDSRQQLDLRTDFEETESDTCLVHVTDDDDLLFTVTELDVDGFTTREYVIKGTSLNVDQIFRPHPPYESCAPISRNLMVGDDPDDPPFIQFADDPTYNFRLDIEEHKYFWWNRPRSLRPQFYLVWWVLHFMVE
jgi:histone-lysine N-methyltransferase EZH2